MRDLKIHGKRYECKYKGNHIDQFVWTEETFMHKESFIRMSINNNGELVHEVLTKVDEWELIIE